MTLKDLKSQQLQINEKETSKESLIQSDQQESNEEYIDSEDDLPRILEEKTFKMSEMIVSWKYVIITDIGLEKFF